MPTINELLLQDATTRATKGPGDVEIGGFWGQVHLSRSYAVAARTLQTQAGANGDDVDVVAPMVFCARHAVELALKDLLIGYQDNQLAQAELDAHDGVATNTKPLPKDILREIATIHELGKLLEWVEQWMPVYVKPGWKALVTEFEKYESNAVERFRYSTVGKVDKRRGHREERSFERVVVIPIGKLLEQLDVFMDEAALIVSSSERDDDWSALEDLAMIGQTLAQEQYARGML